MTNIKVEWRRSDFKKPFARITEIGCLYPYSGGECPACEDSNSDVDTIVDGSPEEVSFRMTCHTCGTIWDEEYALKEVRITVPNEFDMSGTDSQGRTLLPLRQLREAWQESHGL